jgi:indole-3-glycerol phosphate synthase
MSILDRILATKVPEVRQRRGQRSLSDLEAAASELGPSRSLVRALRRSAAETMRVIAEFKRASPSAGAIRAGATPEEIVPLYERAGAAAISVLTDEEFFDGSLDFLGRARGACALPILRKDFIVDPYQVVEARAWGADAVLLIVAALSDGQLAELLACAKAWELSALVEVHDQAEAERAVAAGADIIGVNHRNLRTFEVDTSLTGQLRRSVPDDTVLVGESGIRTPQDISRLANDGADAVLVGESLMRAEDPGVALRHLLAQEDV